MTTRAEPEGSLRCPFASMTLLRLPEQLVGIGFRHWMAGYETGEIARWEQAWTLYGEVLGCDDAHHLVGELSQWVRAVRQGSSRRIETLEGSCRGFCRDECLAISLIAACQHNACPALHACTAALLGCPGLDEVLETARGFSAALARSQQVLSPASIGFVDHIAGNSFHAH